MNEKEKLILRLIHYIENAEAIAVDPKVSTAIRKLAKQKVKEAKKAIKNAERKR